MSVYDLVLEIDCTVRVAAGDAGDRCIDESVV
jgi:hypothetical protein